MAVHGSLGLPGWCLFRSPFFHSSPFLIGFLASMDVKQQKLTLNVRLYLFGKVSSESMSFAVLSQWRTAAVSVTTTRTKRVAHAEDPRSTWREDKLKPTVVWPFRKPPIIQIKSVSSKANFDQPGTNSRRTHLFARAVVDRLLPLGPEVCCPQQ